MLDCLYVFLFRLDPTVGVHEYKNLFPIAEKFLSMKADSPQLFYIWGHSHKFDVMDEMSWERFEEFCALISGKDDIF